PGTVLDYWRILYFERRWVLGPELPLPSQGQITQEGLVRESLLIYPVQRSRLEVWRHCLQPAGISPLMKSVDTTLLLIQMVAACMGVAALPPWVVASVERQGMVVTIALGDALWSRLDAAVRDGGIQAVPQTIAKGFGHHQT
ncbi:LysR substrate-binding domain-containing protein, partial [Salmonella enterica]|uniref:LysR substrate-binding domain-containing protein n=1 Tax=Salmonella enterica TaxID=28901 RepID=UPI00398C32AF